MRSVIVDKVSSVAQGKDLGREIRVGAEIPAEEGVLVAAEILTAKSHYNQLELTSGRMAQVKRGDVIVGALGHRRALFGYSGHLPDAVNTGDVIQLLNLGGVMGVCDSINPSHGKPFDCRVLGAVLEFPYLGERIGVPARVGQLQEVSSGTELAAVPVIALAGTCMDSGKTAAACAIVSRLRHTGRVGDAFKAQRPRGRCHHRGQCTGVNPPPAGNPRRRAPGLNPIRARRRSLGRLRGGGHP